VTRYLCALLAVPLLAAPPPLKVRLGNATVELALERYVAGVVAGESSVFQSDEALKAMAVAARTYAVRLRGRHASEGFDFCATTHCQRLELDAVRPRTESAVSQTAGELLWYLGKPAFACYTRVCGGKTEDAAAVWPDEAAPYLKSHPDPYCGDSSWRWSADPAKLAEALRRSGLRTPRVLESIRIAARTPSGRARTLVLNGSGESIRINAGSFHFAAGRELGWNTVQSDLYEVHGLAFEGRGSGHGVGLCQRGADRMGQAGQTYGQILGFYYPGTELGLSGRGIPWRKLSGETLSLLTTHPQTDTPVLSQAERALRRDAERTRITPPLDIDILLYPDLDTFRNATGEPGWVAAHTEGRKIHLQPAPTLRARGALDSTLRHELLHVLLESAAATGLPVWFREGLADYLESPSGARSPAPPDIDLRQTQDLARARRANREAAGAIRELAARYGEAKLFDWLRNGLPPDVTKLKFPHDPERPQSPRK
jgi:stage II sporulation protein D